MARGANPVARIQRQAPPAPSPPVRWPTRVGARAYAAPRWRTGELAHIAACLKNATGGYSENPRAHRLAARAASREKFV